ncbi:hypothetical protein Tco_0120804 [Tanacetum coccineum]
MELMIFQSLLCVNTSLNSLKVCLHPTINGTIFYHQRNGTSHLVSCNLAVKIWKNILNWWNIKNIVVSTLDDAINLAGKVTIKASYIKFFDAVVQTTLWLLWRYRNEFVFSAKRPKIELLLNDVARPKEYVKTKLTRDTEAWVRSDLIVKSWILGSISEQVTMYVVDRLIYKFPNADFAA